MIYENVVGLYVTNDDEYDLYRKEMAPILASYGGGFRYDFKVDHVLVNEEGRDINRVFLIYFANEKKMNDFFNNEKYLEIKKKYFESSVSATTIISGYLRNL